MYSHRLWTINSDREIRGKHIFVILRNINNIRLEMPYKRGGLLTKMSPHFKPHVNNNEVPERTTEDGCRFVCRNNVSEAKLIVNK